MAASDAIGSQRKVEGVRELLALSVIVFTGLTGCESSDPAAPPSGPPPAAPSNVEATYFNRAVHLQWELAPGWDGESFRIFGKRSTDPDYFSIAQVTSCIQGVCSYRDLNVVPGVTYQYRVAAVGPGGAESPRSPVLSVDVLHPTPPPVPGDLETVALDGALYLRWNAASREDDEFAFYRVYHQSEVDVLIGETDSEGFLDYLVENGSTYGYFVTAVDRWGHESAGSETATGTPRPDYHGELIHAFEDLPEESGFRFQDEEVVWPIVPGTDPDRHFRLEVDTEGWWIVPGPGVQIHSAPEQTTALRCGPAADYDCLDLVQAPASGYVSSAIELIPEFSYVFRVPSASGGEWQYGVIRVTHAGFVQGGAIALFDWAFQLQPGNLNLAPGGG